MAPLGGLLQRGGLLYNDETFVPENEAPRRRSESRLDREPDGVDKKIVIEPSAIDGQVRSGESRSELPAKGSGVLGRPS